MKLINESEFDEEIKEGLVLVDFFATWCGPCRLMASSLPTIEERLEGKARIYKVDVDENPNLAKRFGVLSIPTLIILKDGKEQEKHIGVWEETECITAVKKYM